MEELVPIDLDTFDAAKVAVRGEPRMVGEHKVRCHLEYDGEDLVVLSDAAFLLAKVWSAPRDTTKPVTLKLSVPPGTPAACFRSVDAFVTKYVKDNFETLTGQPPPTNFYLVVRSHPQYGDSIELPLWPNNPVPIVDGDDAAVPLEALRESSFLVTPCVHLKNFTVTPERCTVDVSVVALSVSPVKKKPVNTASLFKKKNSATAGAPNAKKPKK